MKMQTPYSTKVRTFTYILSRTKQNKLIDIKYLYESTFPESVYDPEIINVDPIKMSYQ